MCSSHPHDQFVPSDQTLMSLKLDGDGDQITLTSLLSLPLLSAWWYVLPSNPEGICEKDQMGCPHGVYDQWQLQYLFQSDREWYQVSRNSVLICSCLRVQAHSSVKFFRDNEHVLYDRKLCPILNYYKYRITSLLCDGTSEVWLRRETDEIKDVKWDIPENFTHIYV